MHTLLFRVPQVGFRSLGDCRFCEIAQGVFQNALLTNHLEMLASTTCFEFERMLAQGEDTCQMTKLGSGPE